MLFRSRDSNQHLRGRHRRLRFFVVSQILHVSASVLGGGGRGTRDHYQPQQYARTMALRVNSIQINLTAEIYNKLFKFGNFIVRLLLSIISSISDLKLK